MSLDATSLDELELLIEAEIEWQKYNALEGMYPPDTALAIEHYERHRQCFEAGPTYRHRCFMGGNGTGKSYGVGGYEVALHATGLYPTWWAGIVYDKPITMWVCGDTRETVRDIMQKILLGPFATEGQEALGTGLIPRDKIGKVRVTPNTNNSCDYVLVRHVSGGWATIKFKSYDQGRKAFQGTSIPFILLDEEPPEAIFQECLQRGRGVDGRILLTFTPLSGHTKVVDNFLSWEKLNKEGASVITINCEWDHVPHLSEDWKRETLALTPAYLRNARRRGIPSAGVGAVYPIEEDQFIINPIPLPAHYRRVFGFDHGWHNTAALWGAYDKDSDTVYVYSDYKRGEQPIEVHATALKARGAWIPGVGDSSARDSDGQQIIDKYKAQGVSMRLPDKSVDAGVQEVMSRLATGRLKIFSTCQKTIDEFRRYHYDEKQQIVKRDDHLMDCLRYLCMTGLKHATTQKLQPGLRVDPVAFG